MQDEQMTPTRARNPVPALILIVVGALFLLRNLGIHFPVIRDWWAWLILAASIVPLWQALHAYGKRRHFDGVVMRHLLHAGLMVLVGVMFLQHVEWGVWWPVFVIYAGLYLLVPKVAK